MKTTLLAAALLVSSAAFAQSTTATDPMAGEAQTTQAQSERGGAETPMNAPQQGMTMQPGQTMGSTPGTMGETTGSSATTGASGTATGSGGMAAGAGTMDAAAAAGSPTQPGAADQGGMTMGQTGATGQAGMTGSTGVGGPAQVAMQTDYPICRSRTQDRCRQATSGRRSRR